jgi:hypothetical protein
MSKQPKPSLKSIIASSVASAPNSPEVVPFKTTRPGGRLAEPTSQFGSKPTLKERAKQLSVYLEPAVYDQLRDVAYAERTKIHSLMLEGIDLLFRDRGARSIKDLEKGK